MRSAKIVGILTLVGAATGCYKSDWEQAEAELKACHQDAADQKTSMEAKIAEIEKAKADVEARLAEATALAEKEQLDLAALGKKSQQLASEKGSLAQDMAKLQSQLAELERQEAQERDRAALFQKLLSQLKGMIDSGKLQVVIRNGKMVVKLPDNVLFDPGKTDIKAAGKDALAELTKVLEAIPNRSFQIAGYTDDTPIHTAKFRSNWYLSTARAVEVLNLMIKDGMEPQRLSAAGYGEYDPVASNASVEGKAQNRRIEVTLMPNLDELPKFEESMPTAGR
ncbi:MAG TPA: OmpA family protein [Myxococcales bacterium]|nr:OmpA family protein [Myxococcales bacterium]